MKTSRLLALALAAAFAVSATGCEKSAGKKYQNSNARKEFNDSLNLSEVSASSSEIPDDFSLFLEAEDASFSGAAKAASDIDGFTGSGYAKLEQGEDDAITLSFDIEAAGLYDLTLRSASSGGEKYNYVIVNGEASGEIYTKDESFSESTLKQIYLKEGRNEVSLTPYWGWTCFDNMTITPADAPNAELYTVSADLVNPASDKNTKRLMKFLTDVYGKYIISGQYADLSKDCIEIDEIKALTGKNPAMLGLDMIEYSPSRVENGSSSTAVEKAIDWYWNNGGIVTMCWHWNAPSKYLCNSSEQPWYKGFYTEATNIDLDKIMNGEDDEGYELLVSDIDTIAKEMQRLNEAEVPILWRPLHEASGGWFWWGNCSADSYKKLWNLIYDKFTNDYKFNNLIWVWNGQSPEFYPGDETVDIIGEDIYPGEHVYTSQSGKFTEAAAYTDTGKIIALTENGCLFDPELAFRDNAKWAWFCTWCGEFVVDKFTLFSEQYTETDMWKKVYNHERVLTLDELPDLREYK